MQWIESPSIEATNVLMHHPGVSLILATGGNAMVKAAYSAGKPALGVGAGNVPAYVHKSAKLRRAINDLVLSKSFDNGMICASEQAVILDTEIYDAALAEFRTLHAHLAGAEEKAKLEAYLFPTGATGSGCEPKVNPAAVGQSPAWIAEQAGFTVPVDTSIILVEADRVGPEEPLTREKLCPVLTVLRAGSQQQGFDLAADMVSFHGQGHSAVIHTADPALAEEYGRRMKTVRIIVNAPSSQGAIGGIYNSLLPSLTLGCGSWGSTSVSNNVSAANLLNIKRVSTRHNNLQWFKVPPKIYFEPQAIRYLASMPDVHRVTVVTDATMTRLGFVDRVSRVLQRRREPVTVQVIDNVEPEPSIDSVQSGARLMRDFRPDTIIALGGGSPMDAAKVMWLLYEQPDIDFADMRQKFSDIRKRAFRFPVLGERARLVCIPTTSGTGAEVTPFAVISDPATGKKYPLADYALTPSVAIIDPLLTADLPPALAADSGFDALTHAIEAYVSVYANDFTDGPALHAIGLIFDNLEAAVNDRADRPDAREKMHNAGTIAGMAFGNAFLGIVHAMSHTLGATFHVAHGRTNAVLLPHVIRYNGTVPAKLTGWPKYEQYRAPERFQDIARTLGLPAGSPAEGVESLATAVERLRDAVGIEPSFQTLGVDEQTFLDSLPHQALNAYEDQCAPANPRMPVLDDMQQIMRTAYYGRPGTPLNEAGRRSDHRAGGSRSATPARAPALARCTAPVNVIAEGNGRVQPGGARQVFVLPHRLVRGPLASRESCPGRRQSRAPQHEIGAPPRCGVAPRSGPSRQLSQRFRLTNGRRAQAPRRPCAGRREGDQHDGNGAERPSSQSPQVRRSNCDAGPVSDPSSAALEAPRGELTTRWRPAVVHAPTRRDLDRPQAAARTARPARADGHSRRAHRPATDRQGDLVVRMGRRSAIAMGRRGRRRTRHRS